MCGGEGNDQGRVKSYCIGQSAAKTPKWSKVQRLSKPNNKYNSCRENKANGEYLHEGSRVGLINPKRWGINIW